MKKIAKKLVVKNPEGLHARPAGKLVRILSDTKSTVIINYKGKTVNAKSVLSLLTLGVDPGEEIEVVIEGEDAEKVLKLVESVVIGDN